MVSICGYVHVYSYSVFFMYPVFVQTPLCVSTGSSWSVRWSVCSRHVALTRPMMMGENKGRVERNKPTFLFVFPSLQPLVACDLQY